MMFSIVLSLTGPPANVTTKQLRIQLRPQPPARRSQPPAHCVVSQDSHTEGLKKLSINRLVNDNLSQWLGFLDCMSWQGVPLSPSIPAGVLLDSPVDAHVIVCQVS